MKVKEQDARNVATVSLKSQSFNVTWLYTNKYLIQKNLKLVKI